MKKPFNYYLILSSVLIGLIFLAYNSILPKWKFISIGLGWLWIFFTFFIIIKFWKLKSVKIYSLIIGLLTVLSIIPMGIPLILILSFLFNLSDKGEYQLSPTLKIKQRQYILDREKLYVDETITDYIILEKIKQIGSISFDDIKSEFYPNTETDTISNTIQNITLKEKTKDELIVDIKLNGKSKDVIIYLKP